MADASLNPVSAKSLPWHLIGFESPAHNIVTLFQLVHVI